MLSEKYSPDVSTCLTEIQKEDELKLMKLLIKSRKEKIVAHKPLDPIYSEVYVGWQQVLNKPKMKKRVNTEVQLGERYHKEQPRYREVLRFRDPSNLHSKSVQLPYLSRKGLKVKPKNDSGRASDFLIYKQRDEDKYEPTRTDHKETQKMRRKLIKVVDQVFKDQDSLQQSIEKNNKIHKNGITKKVKLDRIKKSQVPIPRHIRQWHQIEILKLETFFLKLLSNKEHQQHAKGTIEDIREQSTFEKLSIPKKQKIPDYIRQYKLTNPHLNIDELIKKPDFQIVIDDEEIYFGCVLQGKRHKTGISVTKNSRFEGQWVNDSRYEGYEITPQGYYKGKFKDNLRNGQGTFLWKNGEKYEGQWKSGTKHGSGIWKSEKGDSYIGQWNHGKVQGYGVHISANGQRYEGNFHNFLKHGNGKQLFPNGDIYEGEYKMGKPNGMGKYTWKNQIYYEGQFIQGYRHGKGKLVADGYMTFTGQFIGQKPQGKGEILYGNGDSFVGNFKEGEKHGRGTMKYKNNHRIITGIWRNNEKQETEIEN